MISALFTGPIPSPGLSARSYILFILKNQICLKKQKLPYPKRGVFCGYKTKKEEEREEYYEISTKKIKMYSKKYIK